MADESTSPQLPDIRTSWLNQLDQHEGGLYRLIQEVRRLLPAVGRREAKLAAAKVEIAAAAIESLIRSELTGGSMDDHGSRMEAIYSAADELLMMKADLDRKLRSARRDEDDLEFEDKRRRARQYRDELDLELGHGLGGEE